MFWEFFVMFVALLIIVKGEMSMFELIGSALVIVLLVEIIKLVKRH